jgi:predicted lysophospholipase L1 biosynthesis ABC-type transport system permease subunit
MLGKMRWRQLAAWTATLSLLCPAVVIHAKSPKGVELHDQAPRYVPNSFIVEFNPDQVEATSWEVRTHRDSISLWR